MARRSFRDRFFTPPVARAIMSPLGIVLFGVGAAAGILIGAPVVAAAGVGVLAWGGRVLAAIPRDAKPGHVKPSSLRGQWREYVVSAQEAKARFDRIVAGMTPGPLRDNLAGLGSRLDDGIVESFRIADRGDAITSALAQLDTTQAANELAQLTATIHARGGRASDAERLTIQSLEAQIGSGHRLEAVAADARDRLRLLDARFDELVARAVEVSVGAGDTIGLGDDVDQLVTELEALRLALEETNQAANGQPATGQFPAP
jgi:hypothetical protein